MTEPRTGLDRYGMPFIEHECPITTRAGMEFAKALGTPANVHEFDCDSIAAIEAEATAAAEQRLRDARQAVALLDSMIRSGERHSAQSEAIVHAALLNL